MVEAASSVRDARGRERSLARDWRDGEARQCRGQVQGSRRPDHELKRSMSVDFTRNNT